MGGGSEYTKCDMCRKESVVSREYYYYDIKCVCCSNDQHFEIVRYCKDCKPKPPLRISSVVRENDE